MANHKSAKTRIKRNTKRSIINGARKSRVRTFVKKVEAAIVAKDKALAQTAFVTAERINYEKTVLLFACCNAACHTARFLRRRRK